MKEFDYLYIVPTTEVGAEGYRECVTYGANKGDTEAIYLGVHDCVWLSSADYQFDFECLVSNINTPCIRVWNRQRKITDAECSGYGISLK